MKPGELQRDISLLWFLHRHVTLTLQKQNFKLASRVSCIPGGGGGGVFPDMGYTGMCRSTGYVFLLL